jgi:cell wall-associated NlpC family hydrolase
MRALQRPMGAVSVLVVAALAITLGSVAPASADPKFPSWGEVQKAKRNVATKNAEVTKITRIVSSLQGQAAAAGKTALIRGEQYLEAKNALAAATATAQKLESQADAAQARSTASSREAGQLAAQVARQGGGDVTIGLLFSGHDASDLLDVLGAADRLSASTAAVFARAEQDRKAASALSGQAVVAAKARATRAATASAALASAKKASAAAQAKVTATAKEQSTLSAQLASLKGVSASVEKQYLAGVAWEKKQDSQPNPPPDGPPTGGSGPSAPNESAVDGAIRFAKAQLGEPYRLDGAGPSSWDCSGLTLKAYASVGVYIGTHSATDQYNTLKSEGRLVPLSDRQAGDLLWYSNGGSTSAIKYHVTLYIGNGEMIEAPYPGVNVRIAPVRFGDLVPYAGRPTG